MNNYCVYKHIFPNGKLYIGITCQNPIHRWRHDGSGYKPKHRNSCRVWNAIQKYGWDNVTHEILYEGLSKEDAERKEIELIARYQTQNYKYGYNIAHGGSVKSLSDESKAKISSSRKGKNYGLVGENAPMFNKHHSDKSRSQIKNAMTGERNHMFGKHHTEETILLQRKLHEGVSKRIAQLDLSGKEIAIYSSINQAAKETGINKQCISFCANGKYKQAGGYLWKFITSPHSAYKALTNPCI